MGSVWGKRMVVAGLGLGLIGTVGAQEPAPSVGATASDAGPGTVTLQEAGQTPRRALRLAIPEGTTQALTMSMAMDMKTTAMGREIDVSLPDYTVAIDATTRAWDGGDGIRVDWRYGDVTVADGEAAKDLRAALEELEAMSGWHALDARGRVLAAEVSAGGASAGMQPGGGGTSNMSLNLTELAVALPAEPVGVGARWTVDRTLEGLMGMDMKQRITSTLTALDGDRATVVSTVVQAVEPGPIDLSAMSGQEGAAMAAMGMEMSITELTTTGEVTTVIQLDRPMPVDVTARMVVDSDMAMRGAGMDMDMAQHMTMDMGLTERAAEPEAAEADDTPRSRRRRRGRK